MVHNEIQSMISSGIRYATPFPLTDRRDDVTEWLAAHYGAPNLLTGRYMVLEYTIQFVNIKDRDWFILRWGT